MLELHNPADMPDPVKIDFIEEPWIKATILVPDEHLGSILKLCEDRRGIQQELTYVGSRAMLIYRLPLNEVVFDFYDRLKSVSRGYASFDYQLDGYEEGDLVKLSILVNAEPVDALGMIVHRTQAEARGRALCARLKELIPRQLFKIAIQAAIGGKVIARETVSAHAQGRDRQMLWRRHQPQAQAAGQAEGRQEADAPIRQCRDSAIRLHRRAQDRRRPLRDSASAGVQQRGEAPLALARGQRTRIRPGVPRARARPAAAGSRGSAARAAARCDAR